MNANEGYEVTVRFHTLFGLLNGLPVNVHKQYRTRRRWRAFLTELYYRGPTLPFCWFTVTVERIFYLGDGK